MRGITALTASALALACLAGVSPAHAQYGPEGRTVKRTGGPTYTFPWYTLGPQYSDAIQPFFGVVLDGLKTNPIFLKQLTPREAKILQNVRIEAVNNPRPVFNALPVGDGGVIRLSQGSTYFVDTFANVIGRYTRFSDDWLIATFLESEFKVTDKGQRWFQFATYYAWRNYPEPKLDAALNADITQTGRLIVTASLLHELCHIFLGHRPLDTMEFAKSLPIRRKRELDADRCAAELILKNGLNPEYAFTFSIAMSKIARNPQEDEHPANEERWRAMRSYGDALIARKVATGELPAAEAEKYRAWITRLQGVILMVQNYWGKF